LSIHPFIHPFHPFHLSTIVYYIICDVPLD
jgi:hypothetical protein